MIQDLEQIIHLVETDWRHRHVLVVGDLMLDHYIWGEVERISPEAPVPVVRVKGQSQRPGGAGNVAMNIARLGAHTAVVGVCGDDDDGLLLVQTLREAGVDPMVVRTSSHPTTTKLRIIGGKQQMLRLDRERTDSYPSDVYKALASSLEASVRNVDAVVLSDYAKGVLTEELCQYAIRLARTYGVPILVDPKQRNFDWYRGATTICPNLHELSQCCGIHPKEVDAMLTAGQEMTAQLGLEYLTVTMSENGIALLRRDFKFIAPAVARQVFDVSGAGDTVIATLALAAAGGLRPETAVQLANVAAGIAVSKVGTVPVGREELLSALTCEIEFHAKEKVIGLDALRARVSAWRSAGQRIAFTNGCFDLLHVGHIALLEEARREGDRLVVAINSDASVRKLKGPSRPVVGENDRGRVLAALAAVDAVTVFDDLTPLNLIQELRPDVIIKGGDYREDTVVGAREVLSWGGRVRIVPTVAGASTTSIIAKAAIPALP